ncbi:MAG: hypothetical protein MJZ82_02560 [Paludibacteraceae bacterium]|nr:hypothetical protein [Paludibacteraceae bacterium]
MRYQITTESYESKPPKGSPLWRKMRWEAVETDIDKFYDYIRKNHFVRPNLKSTSNYGDREFISSNVIFLDYDKGEITMDEFISKTTITPSFYYKSHSSNPEGNRFRVGYVVDTPICSPDEFKIYSRELAAHNGVISMEDWDEGSFSATRMFCGAEYGFHSTGEVMSLKGLRERIPPEMFSTSNKFAYEATKHETQREPSKRRGLTTEEQIIRDEFFKNGVDWFISQHIQPVIEHSTPISETDLFLFYNPDKYFEVIKKRSFNGKVMSNYHYDDVSCTYKRNCFVDGEHRRNKIAVSLSFIHQIAPELSLTDLLTQELLYIRNNIDNNKNPIDKTWIWDTCIKEYIKPRNFPCMRHKKMSIKKGLLGNQHYKSFIKNFRKDYCLSIYDNSLSVSDNVKIINEYLYEDTETNSLFVNERTLKNYLKEERVIYTNKPIDEVKRLYQEGLLTLDILKEYKGKIDKNSMTKYKRLIS